MRKVAWIVLTAAAVLVLPRVVVAQDGPKPCPPDPEMLFKHLANHDGVILVAGIPADTPEPLAALLKAADKKGDGKVTLEEFVAAAKEHPLPPPPPFGPPPGRFGKRPDLKELLQKWDKDKDGKLSLEEFTEGMTQLHKETNEHGRPHGPIPGGPPPGGPMWGPGGPMPGPGGPGGPGFGPGGPGGLGAGPGGPGGPMPGPAGPG